MRVLVVEDDAAIALVEQKALERDGYEVTVAATGTAGVKLVRSWNPDLLILDHGLPDLDGRDVIKEVRATSRVPIIVVTGRTEETERIASLDLGADDYVMKPFSTPELMARVRAVLRRVTEPIEPPAGPLEFRDLRLDERARRALKGENELALTKIEYDILRMLMQRPGEAVDREAMARGIWNMPAARIGKSLDVHMSVLRRKLGDDPKEPRYIETVRAVGFRMAADAPPAG
jgi:DNA-binding response OmpR family regulator